ncbi:MAG: hypothetical protein MJE68_14530 [Proteobacteria bacterium]|nr:hypothetical protein [Pseudomonadota bacterium]
MLEHGTAASLAGRVVSFDSCQFRTVVVKFKLVTNALPEWSNSLDDLELLSLGGSQHRQFTNAGLGI